MNTDVLVPARTTISIPVSCVEQGRWQHVSPSFSGSGRSASHRTRSSKSSRVHAALKAEGKHDADQAAVWQEVAGALHDSGAASPTMALTDAYARRDRELTEVRRGVRMPPGAVGLAVFHAERFLGLDVFDWHTTLQYFWDSLVDSYAIEFLSTPVDPSKPPTDEEPQVIRSLLDRAAGGKWEPFDPPGEGKDWRFEDRQFTGSSLVWDDKVVVHLQLFPRQAGGEPGGLFRPRIRRRYGV